MTQENNEASFKCWPPVDATLGEWMTVHKGTLSARDVEEGFRRTVGDLVQDRERGFNHWAGTEDSVMLVWASRIYEFLVVLESVLSYPPARGFCREVGYRSGHEGAVATFERLRRKVRAPSPESARDARSPCRGGLGDKRTPLR